MGLQAMFVNCWTVLPKLGCPATLVSGPPCLAAGLPFPVRCWAALPKLDCPATLMGGPPCFEVQYLGVLARESTIPSRINKKSSVPSGISAKSPVPSGIRNSEKSPVPLGISDKSPVPLVISKRRRPPSGLPGTIPLKPPRALGPPTQREPWGWYP